MRRAAMLTWWATRRAGPPLGGQGARHLMTQRADNITTPPPPSSGLLPERCPCNDVRTYPYREDVTDHGSFASRRQRPPAPLRPSPTSSVATDAASNAVCLTAGQLGAPGLCPPRDGHPR